MQESMEQGGATSSKASPSTTSTGSSAVVTLDEWKEHWQDHRRLTRRVIEAFPEGDLFRFSIGGMRPFSELAREMIGTCYGGIRGIALGEWTLPPELDYHSDAPGAPTRPELLEQWDRVTREIDTLWPRIPPERFREEAAAFGEYPGPIWAHVFYLIENEVHHRGQGYVYLRALGIEPPYFWER